jgi:hypothetical protein
MILKYVMIDYSKPILFFEGILHSEFCRFGAITSAGFVNISPDRAPITLGESISLGMKPAQKDAEIIRINIEHLTGGLG